RRTPHPGFWRQERRASLRTVRQWSGIEIPVIRVAMLHDRHASLHGSDLFFNGASAVALYGGPVPITYGNPHPLGNEAPRSGSDLLPDLMNGIVFTRDLEVFVEESQFTDERLRWAHPPNLLRRTLHHVHHCRY